MKHIPVEKGLNVHLLQTRKFKTTVITVLLRTDLTKENATKNALLAGILRSGCKRFESSLKIAAECEEMYGAVLEISVVKKGEEHIIQLYIETLNGKFCENSGDSVFERAGKLLNSLLFEPLITEGGFKPEYVELQKEQLKQAIAGKINDKKKYALDRMIEIMCAEERFGVSGEGYIELLDQMTPQSMYGHYVKLIAESPIEIGIIGDLDTAASKEWAKRYFTRNSHKIHFCEPPLIIGVKNKLRTERETLGINQGKLVIGARCNFPYKGDDFFRLLLFSEIFGGGSASKLFKTIREKHSLCYYVNSFIYRAKAILVIQAGIEEKDYDKTLGLISSELEAIKGGGISDEELSLAKSAIISQMETLKDSPQGLSSFYMTNVLLGDDTEINDFRGIFERFTKKEVCGCADRISLDTAYFLA